MLLRGHCTYLHNIMLYGVQHTKLYAHQITFSTVSLKTRVNLPPIKFKGEIIIQGMS